MVTGILIFLEFRLQPGTPLLQRLHASEDTAMENLARYIIYPEGHTRASFSQERMQYLDQVGKVVYTSKDKKTSKVFPALEWLAAMCSHIPNRGDQKVSRFLKRAAAAPPPFPNRIASPCFSMHNIP